MISAKCTHCARQLGKHQVKTMACPVGNPRDGHFSIDLKFTPKPTRARSERVQPKAKRGKGSEGRKDRATRRAVKAEPCVACGLPPGNPENPVDVCHVRSWKVSQCDEPWNCIAQCRLHHREQHAHGWLFMAKAYPGVGQALKERGWEFIENIHLPLVWSMFNEKEVALNLARRSV